MIMVHLFIGSGAHHWLLIGFMQLTLKQLFKLKVKCLNWLYIVTNMIIHLQVWFIWLCLGRSGEKTL